MVGLQGNSPELRGIEGAGDAQSREGAIVSRLLAVIMSVAGSTGKNTVFVGPDNDHAFAEAGSDNVLGIDGAGVLYGGSEADKLDGGADTDQCNGGPPARGAIWP
jgi:Ca2+-binding RTX toxin-like protein